MTWAARYLANKTALRVVFILTLLLSLSGLLVLRWGEDTSVQPHSVQIVSFLPGVAAEAIDKRVGQPLLEGIRLHIPLSKIQSLSYDGVSILMLQLPADFSPLLLSQLERSLTALRTSLPVEVEGPMLISPQERAIDAMIALTADGFTLAELEQSAAPLLNTLSGLDEIARQQLLGRKLSATGAGVSSPAMAMTPTAYADGRPALLVLLDFRNGVDHVRFGRQLKQLLQMQQASLPHGIDIRPVFLSTDEIRSSVSRYGHLLIQSLAMALILFVLLIRGRQSLVVAGAFLSSYLLFFLALEISSFVLTPAMVAGLLVAMGPVAAVHWLGVRCLDALHTAVEQRDTHQNLSWFWRRWLIGWSIVGIALVAGVAPFLSELGRLWSGAAALLVVVLLMFAVAVAVSMLALPLFYTPAHSNGHISLWSATYQTLLCWIGQVRWLAYFVLLALFMLVVKGLLVLPTPPVPDESGTLRRVEFLAPAGTTQNQMTALMLALDDWLASRRIAATVSGASDAATWVTLVGQPVPGLDLRHPAQPSHPLGRTNYAAIYIRYPNERAARTETDALRTEIATHWPELSFQIENPVHPVVQRPDYTLRVLGDDAIALSESVTRLRQRLLASSAVVRAHSDWEPVQQIRRLSLSQERLNRMPEPLQEAIEALDLRKAQDPDAVWVSAAGEAQTISLAEMAEWRIDFVPATVVRENGYRMARLEVDFHPGVTELEQQRVIDSVLMHEQAHARRAGLTLDAAHSGLSGVDYVRTHARHLLGMVWVLMAVFLIRYRSLKKALILLVAPLSGGVGVVGGIWFGGLGVGPVVLVAGLLVILFGIFAALAFAECQEGRRLIGWLSQESCLEESGRQWVAPFLLAVGVSGCGIALMGLTTTALWWPFAVTFVSGILVQWLIGALMLPVIYGRACVAGVDAIR